MHIETKTIGDTVVHVSGAGLPLVFVHGFTTTAQFWREQIEAFSSRYRVIRIDLPGHGVSPRPEGRSYTIAAFANDILAVYRALEIDEAILVGLSMGGTVAQTFTLSHPERVLALVLVGATPHGLGADVNVDNVLKAIDDLGVVKASQNVIERSFGRTAGRDLVEFARQEVTQTPAFVAREAIASLNASDSRANLHDIGVPTLVVVGTEDIITPPGESVVLAEGIPESRLEVIADAGHFPMLEQPQVFNHVLESFLKDCDSHFSRSSGTGLSRQTV
ncbi:MULTISPECIES: alpha/beta fold hydrolase [Rhizobium]|uniref:Alpha/beta fold hydrolase n=1 Tax=Rhizobium leguminosarum bv. viciae TaxID=387 RepID=A0A8G2MM02_RHILV|nr:MULTISPECIES: alpha/beta fold hydrolase [Rhizobium]MBC2806953.1 alpha/beta fold hydrolase [Rhizobium ruizarguesonis]MBY3238629.1 alpha/beta fold hydrolase [Rhizobium laguerreae]MBY5315362.1 alpha/beta fold hydrolase [Rhizobium leguminosarum]MBY5503066.1 alpha/beta fold hydrolase [Rhizobium leguminosarum]MBY5510805.1 alpha/beta fold hydrolase [Rhizobium leguminosarum]